MQTAVQRRFPVGAEPVAGGVNFRVWAPRRKQVELVLEGSRAVALERESDGYFSAFVDFARPGALYRFRLDHGDHLVPDPASRFQPEGPHGPSQKEFSETYFTDRYVNEWGEAINFDGRESEPVREFFISNAAYWIEEFHLDGLRLDATQQIFDNSHRHILADKFVMGYPHERTTFERCKLNHEERRTNAHILELHRDLLKLRREDPVFRAQRSDWIHGAVLGDESFVLRYFGNPHGDRLLLVNLGRELRLRPGPEPLLAPSAGPQWEILWSSEDPQYRGSGRPPMRKAGTWNIPAHCAVVMYERNSY